MNYEINPNMVAGIMKEINAALLNQGYKNVEVVIALQELVGRTIVEMSATPVMAEPIVALAHKHLDDTCKVGFSTRGQSNILRV